MVKRLLGPSHELELISSPLIHSWMVGKASCSSFLFFTFFSWFSPSILPPSWHTVGEGQDLWVPNPPMNANMLNDLVCMHVHAQHFCTHLHLRSLHHHHYRSLPVHLSLILGAMSIFLHLCLHVVAKLLMLSVAKEVLLAMSIHSLWVMILLSTWLEIISLFSRRMEMTKLYSTLWIE